jgi:hypothetical protein
MKKIFKPIFTVLIVWVIMMILFAWHDGAFGSKKLEAASGIKSVLIYPGNDNSLVQRFDDVERVNFAVGSDRIEIRMKSGKIYVWRGDFLITYY